MTEVLTIAYDPYRREPEFPTSIVKIAITYHEGGAIICLHEMVFLLQSELHDYVTALGRINCSSGSRIEDGKGTYECLGRN